MDYLDPDDELLRAERQCRREGFFAVAGVDEAGRGPLAGPVVAAAVCFADERNIPCVADSKVLSDAQRRELAEAIRNTPGVRYGIAEVDAGEIDRINILRATHSAMRLAVEQLGDGIDFVLIDGNPVKGMPLPNRSIVKGDAKCASIAAASILAKVFRDDRMLEYDKTYPEYHFAAHKGYGTAVHLAALREFGPCPIHRRTFAPVRAILEPPDFEQTELF